MSVSCARIDTVPIVDGKGGNMAQKVTGSKGTRRKTTTKQQKEEERKIKIEQLSEQIDQLRSALSDVNEERATVSFPILTGKNVEHIQYGPGTVTGQKDAVLTIDYAGSVRRQKLPFVLVSGCITQDDAEAVEICRKIDKLQNEQSRLQKEIEYRQSRISDLERQKI